MSEPLSIVQVRIRPACDECYRVKRRCDSTIPICSRCKLRGKKCTRNRKSSRKPRMHNNEDFHSQTFLLSQTNKVKRKIKFKSIIILNHRYFNQYKISVGGSRFDSNTSMASVFPIKMFHSPLIFDQTSYFFYNAAPNQFLISFFSKMPSVPSKSNTLEGKVSIHHRLPQLISTYFEKVNVLLPLFTYNQFMSKKRDVILICSIMLVALTHIDDSDELSYTKTFLKDKLLKHFQPSRLKINLSNIQSMVILLNGLKGSSSALPSYYFSNLNNYCVQLGLHLNCKNDIERKLCYSAAVFLLSIDDSYSNLSFDTHSLWKNDNISLKLSSTISTEVIMQSIMLTYSNYCYRCGLVFKNFFDATMHINVLNITNAKTIKISYLLENLMNTTTETAISRLGMIKKAALCKSLSDTINVIIGHIKIIHHSSWSLIYNIRCLASFNNRDFLFSRYIIKEKPKDAHLLEDNIQSFMYHSSNLKSKYYSSMPFFAFLIIIDIISAYSNWITNGPALLDQILDQFDLLSKNNNMRLVSAINLIVQIAVKK